MAAKEAKAPAGAPTLASSILEARDIAPELSAVTDELNRALMRVEKALVGMRLGVIGRIEIESSVSPDSFDDIRRYTNLVFIKQGAQWGLFIEEGSMDHNGEGPIEREPLLSASKALRIQAADVLPALVKLLVDEARKQRDAILKRAQAMNELATLLTGKTAAEDPVVFPVKPHDDEIPF